MSSPRVEKPSPIADYHVGETWFSYDNGYTWFDRHYFDPSQRPEGAKVMVITSVDHLNGKITIEIA